MEKRILWDKEIRKCFIEFDQKHLEDFMELLDHIGDNHIENIICADTQEDAALWEWLYSKDQIELNDLKRELSRKIERAKCAAADLFDKMSELVGKLAAIKTLILLYDNENVFLYLNKTGVLYGAAQISDYGKKGLILQRSAGMFSEHIYFRGYRHDCQYAE